jgi:SAM domain (Sterile alpha motif)
MDVADWLRALGLEQYEATFRENDVRPEDLRHLTAEDLEGLGVTAIGHRRRLLVAIAKLNEQSTTETVSRRAKQRSSRRNRWAKTRCRRVVNAAS